MLVMSEGAKIRKKREEEERRRMMAEGFDKLQKALDEKVAARAAVQAVNEDLKAVSIGEGRKERERAKERKNE